MLRAPMIPNSKAAARQPVPVGLVRFGAGSPPSVATASVASASTAAVIDLPSGKQMPDWPQVPCASCSQLSHWKDNRQDKVWMGQCGWDDVDEDGQWVVNYYCVKCVAKEMGDVEDQVARAHIAAVDLSSGKQLPDWPQAPCTRCSQLSHWKNNRQDKVWVDNVCDDSSEDGDFRYYCVKCVADKVALAHIRSMRQDLQKRMERTPDYTKATENPPDTSEFEHGNRKQRRVITRRQMLEIWRPAAHAILIKAAQLQERANYGDRHAALLKEMKRARRGRGRRP